MIFRIYRREIHLHLSVTLFAVILLAIQPRVSSSQVGSARADTATTDIKTRGLLAVFLDCAACDFDYIRTEIPWVNYVRDRADADVHIIGVSQPNASGGTLQTFTFLGRRAFSGVYDTLTYTDRMGASMEQARSETARILKIGLLKYASKTVALQRLRVDYSPEESGKPNTPRGSAAHDPWRNWVFNVGATGSIRGEKSSGSGGIGYSFAADRTTEAWKITLSFNGSRNSSRFTLGDGSRFVNRTHASDLNAILVKSLGNHWAVGQRLSLNSSTFFNQKQAVRVAPALEYNIYPYSDITRRAFTVQYSAGINRFRYEDTTLYNRISETLGDHRIAMYLGILQPWGNIRTTVEWAAFMSDMSKQHLSALPSVDIRVWRGLSLNLFGIVSLTRDQLYLPRQGLSDEQILLQQRALATSYSYTGNLGFSYFFGSKFNNTVNPRLNKM